MGKRIFPVRAALRPDFRAIFKSTDYLYIKALTFEPLFQTPPLLLLGFWGLLPNTPPNNNNKPFFHLPWETK